MFGILVGVFMLVILVVVHEYGHFLAAKRNGVEVEEFGIGFPPRLYGKKMGRGIFRGFYSINLIPLGGFVRLKGENESAKSKGSFGAASLSTKIKIAVAGVAMNALVAVALLTYLAATGMPKFIEDQVQFDSQIEEVTTSVAVAIVDTDTPAESLQLKEGDVISAINGVQIDTESELLVELDNNKAETVRLSYFRNGQERTTEVTLLDGSDDRGILGVVPIELSQIRHSLIAAPVVGLATTGQIAYLTLEGVVGSLARLVVGNFSEAAANVTGPVGIFSMIDSLSALGFSYLVFFTGIISITLAVINILPLPALDGGRLMVSIIVHKFKFELTEARENIIHLTGFVLLLLLAILVTIVDIGRI